MSGNDKPAVVLLPPVIFAIALVATGVLDWLLPFDVLPSWQDGSWNTWLGAALSIAGIAMGLAGIIEFRRARTNISPHLPALRLVTSGIYRVSRNPMYLGMLFLFAGLILILGLEPGLISWPLFAFTLHHGVVRREEDYLIAKFGQPYRELMERSRRWI